MLSKLENVNKCLHSSVVLSGWECKQRKLFGEFLKYISAKKVTINTSQDRTKMTNSPKKIGSKYGYESASINRVIFL